MSDSDLLFLPENREMLPILNDSAPSLFFNVPYTAGVADVETVDIVHFMKPGFDEWERNGCQPQKCILENASYDRVYYWGEKSAQASRFYLAYLLARLNDGGYLIAAAKNDENGKRYQKWFEEFGLQPQSISKKKTRIVFAKKETVEINVINQVIEEALDYKIYYNGVDFKTHPGIFSAQKIDQGSLLLIENLSDDLKGVGADFGCGYGFLASQINHNAIKEMHLLDADARALSCCRQNLGEDYSYHWADLNHQPDLPPLDFIVMNPPFHDGKKQESDVGKNFIINAAKSLKKNGALYMVANVFLPYEQTLKENFQSFEKLIEQDGFKVFKAVR